MEPTNGTGRHTVTVTATTTAAGDDTQGWVNRRATAQATRGQCGRSAGGGGSSTRRPARRYSIAEMEFMQAMHDYKQQSGRMFPTWSEVLEVLKSLGYAKPQSGPVVAGVETSATATATACKTSRVRRRPRQTA